MYDYLNKITLKSLPKKICPKGKAALLLSSRYIHKNRHFLVSVITVIYKKILEDYMSSVNQVTVKKQLNEKIS